MDYLSTTLNRQTSQMFDLDYLSTNQGLSEAISLAITAIPGQVKLLLKQNERPEISPLQALKLIQSLSAQEFESALAQLSDIAARGYTFINFTSQLFPARLAATSFQPLGLYVWAKAPKLLADLNQLPAFGIVGARRASQYGVKAARKISKELSLAGSYIVSGLAVGIDSAAHQGAYDAALERLQVFPGIAVLGSGFDCLYPKQNRVLAERLVEQGGIILSEYHPDQNPTKFTFPERNRIIAGLVDALIVIEAGEKSGSLITARLAADAGRQVFALPGEITNPYAQGSNKLIRNGATLIQSVADVFEDLPHLRSRCLNFETESAALPLVATQCVNSGGQLDRNFPAEMGVLSQQIIAELEKQEALPFDQLLPLISGSAVELRAELSRLEMAGRIFSHPGDFYSISEFVDIL
ncbi:DNA-protecting protein DprA [bacterium]|nr:DNA-protecting protein DprA [bacterium]